MNYHTVSKPKNFKTHRKTVANYTVLPVLLLKYKNEGVLSANDIAVIGYLLSFYSEYRGIRVTQKRISEQTMLSSGTVKNVVDKLYNMGLIDVIQSNWDGKRRETNIYVIKNPLLDMSGGFFYVPRNIFKKELCPKELLVYFFFCHSHNNDYTRSWNSYTDIAKRLRLNRSEVICLVKMLVAKGLIKKSHKLIRKSGKGEHYADNRYEVTWLSVFLNLWNKKNALISNSPTKKIRKAFNKKSYTHYNSLVLDCQDILRNFWTKLEKDCLNDKNIRVNSYIKKRELYRIKADKSIKALLEQIYLDSPELYHGFPF